MQNNNPRQSAGVRAGIMVGITLALLLLTACGGHGSGSGDDNGGSGSGSQRGGGNGSGSGGGGGGGDAGGGGSSAGGGSAGTGSAPPVDENGYRLTGSDKWKLMNSGTHNSLVNLWGSAANDMYAVGVEGTAVHFDGSQWQGLALGTASQLWDVWGSSASEVYIVGTTSYVLDGGHWQDLPHPSSESLSSVWLSGPGEVYVLDYKDRIYHRSNNGPWTLVYEHASNSTATKVDLYQIRGSGPDNIYVAGIPTLHYDGRQWQEVDFGAADGEADSVWVNGPADVYLLAVDRVYHYDGNGWSVSQTGAGKPMKRIWAQSLSAMFVVGDGIYRFDGATWNSDIDPNSGLIYGIWGVSPGEVYGVGGSGRAVRYVPAATVPALLSTAVSAAAPAE